MPRRVARTSIPLRLVGVLLALAASGCGEDGPGTFGLYAPEIGGPIQGLDEATLARWEAGKAVMERSFAPSEGLGPEYNATSCASCHHFPATGGSANRFRDVHLLQAQAPDGTRDDRGTHRDGPLRKMYSVEEGHVAPPPGASVFARRVPLSALGVGLFALVADEDILAHEDPDDADGDGISGRAHRTPEGIGRFGYKAQAATLERVARGALKDQMGITTPGVDFVPALAERRSLLDAVVPSARAHPSNLDEDPEQDGDAAPDPELGGEDLRDLITFLAFVAPPPPVDIGQDDAVERGRTLFGELGCMACHRPTLPTPIGPIPAWTDLLLHDMGDAMGPDVAVGDAGETEWRTTPLIAVRLHIPYMHDNSAPAYRFSTQGHGGEALASSLLWQDLGEEDRGDLNSFLDSLGGWNPKGRVLAREGDPLPAPSSLGGTDGDLGEWGTELWGKGRDKFDRGVSPSFDSGLGRYFNGDSCRSCHFQPALGGAGGNDVNVLLVEPQEGGEPAVWPLVPGTLPRTAIPRVGPWALADDPVVVEPRNTPSLLGLGRLDRVPAEAILALADPDDSDGDGISGRARILPGGRLGRFGWKAGVPSLLDFTCLAMRAETSITVDPDYSYYTSSDDGDEYADPELQDAGPLEITWFVEHLAPPGPNGDDPAGRAAFDELGCGDCHVPDLAGVAAYTDLLMHDVAPPDAHLVNLEPDLLPTEFRTPPLWGVSATAPYLHDGGAETLRDAIEAGHFGEATAARQAFEGAAAERQTALLRFLGTL
jgi:CxxC motif-containing protein (DUF1111 family)